MATIPTTRLLYQTQRRFETEFGALMDRALNAAIGRVLRAAGDDGTIPPARALGLIREVQDDVSAVLVGVGGAPVSAEGVGLSPYARTLVRAIDDMEAGLVEAHSAFIRANVTPPVGAWLLRSAYPGLPQVAYEAAHTWVDPAGYRLSDRIWNASTSARAKIDRYLSYNIPAGTSAQRMARELEGMLLPGREVLRTTKPYGVNVSYDAMRLARTEITRSHSALTRSLSAANPFTTGLDFALSARHPKFDICDGLASIGMGGERKREAYPVESAPVPVQDSHPQCLCVLRPYVSEISQTVRTLSERMEAEETPPVTPIDGQRFLTWVKQRTSAD